MYKLDLGQAEEPEIKLPTSIGSWKKQESSRKTSISASWTTLKPLSGSQQTAENSWIDGDTRPPCPSPEKPLQVKKQQLEPDMEQWTGAKLGKEYVKAVHCYPAYLTYMQGTSIWNAGLDEAQAGIKIAGRNINNLRYAADTTLMTESEEELNSLLMKVKKSA